MTYLANAINHLDLSPEGTRMAFDGDCSCTVEKKDGKWIVVDHSPSLGSEVTSAKLARLYAIETEPTQ
jgi:hypothetical protein